MSEVKSVLKKERKKERRRERKKGDPHCMTEILGVDMDKSLVNEQVFIEPVNLQVEEEMQGDNKVRLESEV